jgi:putative ABC transport system permease protein
VRPGAWAELVGRDLRRSLRSFSVAAAGIVAGVATLAFFLGLSAGMRAVVLGQIFPIDRVEVIPPESAVGSVLGSLLGARTPGIEAAQVDTLVRVPGVRAVSPRLRFAFPSSGRGGRAIFGRDLGAGEIPADGVDAALVQAELGAAAGFDDPDARASHRACQGSAEGQCPTGEYCFLTAIPSRENPAPAGQCSPPVPMVVSPYLIEVFNGAIAPAHGIPPMGALLIRQATGMVLEWDLGRAGLGSARQGTPRRVYARLAGVSRHALDLGVTVPMEVARRFNREYAGEDAATRYSSVAVYLRDPGATTAVGAAVRAVGLEVKSNGAEQVGLLVTAITAILSLASVITVVVASLNIAQVFFAIIAERRGEIGLLRALGATRRDVGALVLGQALVLGFGSSVAGIALARAAAGVVNHLANTQLPAFPFKPSVWFVFEAGAMGAVVAFGVGACVLSALAPAVRASRVEPAEALAGGV